MRILIAVTLACLAGVNSANADPASAGIKHAIDVRPQALAPALRSYATETGLHLIYISEDVRARHSDGARGSLTAAEALSRILRGTGLTYHFLDADTISIVPIARHGVSAGAAGDRIGGTAADPARKTDARKAPKEGQTRLRGEAIELQPVFVTATRRPEEARTIAGSITAFTGDELDALGAQGFSDYLTRAPGVAFNYSIPGDSTIVIRGVSTTTFPEQGEGTTAYFINDVPLTDPFHSVAIPRGKATVFVCPYHGWGYNLDGKLRGVPRADGYGERFNKDDYPLFSLRVEDYAGMIFATFRYDIEPLVDFLGAAKKWIDLFMKQGGGFGVKTLGEHRFRFRGNWKIQLENTTDAYHFPVVHRTFLKSLDEETEELFDVLGQGGWVEELGNGHSVMVMIPDLVDLEADLDRPIPQRFAALAAELRAEGRPEEQVRRIVRAVGGSGFNLNLFPNVACSMAFFRVLRPISVEETEIRHLAIGMDGGPEAANRMRLRLHEYFQGPMGFGSPDDAEGWERVQRGAAAGEDLWIMVSRGGEPRADQSSGKAANDVSSEAGMRASYAMWKRMMEGQR